MASANPAASSTITDTYTNMSDTHSIPLDVKESLKKKKKKEPKPEELKQRRSSALEKIEEIFNPTLKLPDSTGPYVAPAEVHAGDVDALNDLDERKLMELKEVFTMFDTDADGVISPEDLRCTFMALGKEPTDDKIQQMMEEAMQPLTFESFVMLMGFKTIELDPEDVLLEAWSKWDIKGTGLVEEDVIYNDLITYGERLTKREAQDALDEAPIAKAKTLEEPPMIDYQAFCKMLCGLRKRKEL